MDLLENPWISKFIVELVVSLVPSLDLQDLSLLQLLANNVDFFLGEAIAMEIEAAVKGSFAGRHYMC